MPRSTGRPEVVRAAPAEHEGSVGPVRPSGSHARGWSLDMRMIDRRRLLRGWTRRDLARAAQVDEKTLRDMMSARRRPTFGTVQAVCTSLGLTLPDVIVFADED